jgi:HAD superfamily hydrolase (TIGR01662 family)
MIKALIFDWGGTVMTDFGYEGPMYLWPSVSLVPGVEEALEKLSEQYTLSIATNAGISDTKAMKKALKRVNALRFFHYFFSSKELKVEKPDPLFFEKISKKIAIPPQSCIMIGNDYEKDIIGAKAAGMKTVFYNPSGIVREFDHADRVILSMNSLPAVIKELTIL